MLFLAFLIGVIAGMRTLMAPTAIAFAAVLGKLSLDGSWLSFFSWRFTPWIVTFLVLGELYTDKLASTPSRKVPIQFAGRLVSGGLCGAAIGFSLGSLWPGLALGFVGALVGTLAGSAARSRMAASFGNDRSPRQLIPRMPSPSSVPSSSWHCYEPVFRRHHRRRGAGRSGAGWAEASMQVALIARKLMLGPDPAAAHQTS